MKGYTHKYHIYSSWCGKEKKLIKREHHFAEAWKWAWNWWKTNDLDDRETIEIYRYENGKPTKKWTLKELGEYFA